MKILFMGTPDFAASCLGALVDHGEDIVAVVTQPDRQKGRGMNFIPSPVKVYATEHGIPVYQPATLRDEAFAALLSEIAPELIIVAAYGKILPKNVLDYPKHGCINAHASLLPKYRGAAPIQRAIMDGERVTGVTAMYMAEGLDTGDMLLTRTVTIEENDDFGTVHDKLCVAGGDAMCAVCDAIRAGTLSPEKQDDSLSTYAEKITKEEGSLDFSLPATAVHNRIRAMSPIPLSYTKTTDGKLLKIVSAKLSDADVPTGTVAGTVISTKGGEITVACCDGAISVTGVVPEGKSKMRAADFINGRKIAAGDILGIGADK